MKYLIAFILGFVAYPAVFVPVMMKWFPQHINAVVEFWASYYRMWF